MSKAATIIQENHHQIKTIFTHYCGKCNCVLGVDVYHWIPWQHKEEFNRVNFCYNCGTEVEFTEIVKTKGTAAGY